MFGFPTGLVLLRELPLSPLLGYAAVSGTARLLGQRLRKVKMPSLVQPAIIDALVTCVWWHTRQPAGRRCRCYIGHVVPFFLTNEICNEDDLTCVCLARAGGKNILTLLHAAAFAFATYCTTPHCQLLSPPAFVTFLYLLRSAIGLVVKLGFLAAKIALVETPKYIAAAAATHDGIILGQEVEAIGENMLSVIHNQAKTFGEVQAQAANLTSAINTTRTTVLAAAGGIPRIVSCMLPCWQNPGVT